MTRAMLMLVAGALLGGGCLGGSMAAPPSTRIGIRLPAPATHVGVDVVVHGVQPWSGGTVGRDLIVRLRLSCSPVVPDMADSTALCRKVNADMSLFRDTSMPAGCYGGPSPITISVDGVLAGKPLSVRMNSMCGPAAGIAWLGLVRHEPAVAAAVRAAGPGFVRVPDVRGMGFGQAIARLQKHGLLASLPAGWSPDGVVSSQSRPAGSRAPAGSTVGLEIGAVAIASMVVPSTPPPAPRLVGLPYLEALAMTNGQLHVLAPTPGLTGPLSLYGLDAFLIGSQAVAPGQPIPTEGIAVRLVRRGG